MTEPFAYSNQNSLENEAQVLLEELVRSDLFPP